MLDILFNIDNYPFTAGFIIYLMLCQSLAKLKGFKYWYMEGLIYGLSIPLMVLGVVWAFYEAFGGY